MEDTTTTAAPEAPLTRRSFLTKALAGAFGLATATTVLTNGSVAGLGPDAPVGKGFGSGPYGR